MNLDAPEIFLNRDLSWLDFNLRVLAEGENPDVPILERLKFLAITASNLDEFFMVRVALLHRATKGEQVAVGPDGMSHKQALADILKKSRIMVDRLYACFDKAVLPGLSREGISLVRVGEYTAEDRTFVERFFEERVMPVITPLAVDPAHPFPLLASGAVYVLFKVKPLEHAEREQFYGQTDTVLVQIPRGLSRFFHLPSSQGKTRVALLGDAIKHCAASLLGGYAIDSAYFFRITRDAELSVDDEQADDLMAAIVQQLRTRRKGSPVRLEIEDAAPAQVESFLRERLGLRADDVFRISSILNLKGLFELLPLIDQPRLANQPWPPQQHPLLVDEDYDIFEILRKQDIMIQHPYQSFDPVVKLVERAASDCDVLAIKVTLYRVSGDSPIVEALIRAAENGKQVTALVELRARFDEEANISWARRLDNAGAHVIYGVVGYKTHAKALLIVRQEHDGIRRYVHLSTGNYNDKTARIYTDLGYLTAREEFGADVSAFFNVVTGYALPPRWNRIEMAPTGLRKRIVALIEREIEKHSPETPGLIRAKMNALIDADVIKALYRASIKGVKVELAIRGMCRLRAGVKRLSENIRVVSVLDRFLEHSRILHFRNGGSEEVYCSSADWMERNLDRRLELLYPILDANARQTALSVIDAALGDNIKAWTMQPDSSYLKAKVKSGAEIRRSQEVLYKQACELARQGGMLEESKIFVAKASPVTKRRGKK